jgi:hypothetical protein
VQTLFLNLLQVQAVLVGTTFALLVAILQLVAGRFSPSVVHLALRDGRLLIILGLLVAFLLLLSTGAVITTVEHPAPDATLAPGSRQLHAILVAVGAVGIVILSVGLSMAVIWAARRYMNPRDVVDRFARDLAASSKAPPAHRRWRRPLVAVVHAVTGTVASRSRFQPALETMQSLVRDGDRLAHEFAAERILSTNVEATLSGPRGVRVPLVTDFLQPAIDLARAQGTPLFVGDIIRKTVRAAAKNGIEVATARDLLEFAAQQTGLLLLDGDDDSAAPVLESWWSTCADTFTPDDAGDVNLWNVLTNLGLLLASTARPSAARVTPEAAGTEILAYSLAVDAWQRGACAALRDAPNQIAVLERFLANCEPVLVAWVQALGMEPRLSGMRRDLNEVLLAIGGVLNALSVRDGERHGMILLDALQVVRRILDAAAADVVGPGLIEVVVSIAALAGSQASERRHARGGAYRTACAVLRRFAWVDVRATLRHNELLQNEPAVHGRLVNSLRPRPARSASAQSQSGDLNRPRDVPVSGDAAPTHDAPEAGAHAPGDD